MVNAVITTRIQRKLCGEWLAYSQKMFDNGRVKTQEQKFIWQREDWPNWRYDLGGLADLLARVSLARGVLLGRMADAGISSRTQANLATLVQDVVKTSEVEGEILNVESVRSSLARRLGVEIGGLASLDRNVDGVVQMVLDATGNAESTVTRERLFGWHASLFPTGYSGLSKIRVGAWRDDANGAMQVVSGPVGRWQVHFQAPPAECLDAEMDRFLGWLNSDSGESALIKAGLGHLWFVTLHPFDDGNGRIARAIGDLLLSRADGSPQRFYSLSAQIQRERKAYYDILEQTQKGDMDVTAWLSWFLTALNRSIEHAELTVDAVLAKARFWRDYAGIPMNPRQVKLLNQLLDGFDGKLTSGKWAKIAKCSQDTALRDINDLLVRGVLRKASPGGRSTSYELNRAGIDPA